MKFWCLKMFDVFQISEFTFLDITGEFSKEDLAAAVVANTLADMVQFVILQALASDIKVVYFCGAMIDHPFAQKMLTFAFFETMLGELRPVRHLTFSLISLKAIY